MAILTRQAKGAPLTHSDVDANWDAVVALENQVAISGAIASSNRARVNYRTGSSIWLWIGALAPLCGFRFMGNNSKSGRSIATGVNGRTIVESADGADLGIETTRAFENWYAVFACANAGDASCVFKLMPYLRVASKSGSVVTLGQAGEGKTLPLTARTYAWANDALNGLECLVINEGGYFVGRVTTITDSTNGTLTLADATNIVDGDFLLPAPPNFTEFGWVADHYMDTHEWRNIADTGRDVQSYMIDIVTIPATGAISTAQEYSFAGYISPLATMVMGNLTYSLSTTSGGSVAHYFWHDSSNHEIASAYQEKVSSASATSVATQLNLGFSVSQSTWISTAGALAASITGRSFRVLGWTVP